MGVRVIACSGNTRGLYTFRCKQEKLKGRLMRLSIAAGFVLWPLLCLATFHPVLLLDTRKPYSHTAAPSSY